MAAALRLLVVGASGQVGGGISRTLAARGHHVVASARNAAALATLAGPRIETVPGSVATDDEAAALAERVGSVSGVIVSVNSARRSAPLLSYSTEALAERISGDLLAHFTAARTFLPRLPRDGVLLGIGGGSADFILEGGVYMSMAQAALRMMYRGLAHENETPHIRQLTVASVVNSPATREGADPAWVTDAEISEQAAAMVERPDAFPGTVWRIARRDESGRPVISVDGATDARGLPL